MFDYGLSVMEQYDMEVKTSYRGRGALLLHTEKGLFILQPFQGSKKRLAGQQKLLLPLGAEHGLRVDVIVPNKEGELVSCDSVGDGYVLRRWYEGRECDTRQEGDIFATVAGLARLHKGMKMPVEEDYVRPTLHDEFARHNRELRKIQRYIRKRGVRNTFERMYLNTVEEFLVYGTEALECLRTIDYAGLHEKALLLGSVCHGDFNQHHVLLDRQQIAYTGFDKWGFGIQMVDLYSFMRKILEKYGWNAQLGAKMLKAYETERPISREERQYLVVRFSYPEKYWKLANHYYTHNKAWISDKTIEKMQVIINQKEDWRNFWKNPVF